MKTILATIIALVAVALGAPAHAIEEQLQPDPNVCTSGDTDAYMTEAEWETLELGVHKREVRQVVGTWGERFKLASTHDYLVREYHLCANDGRALTVGLMFTRSPIDGRWVLDEKG